MGDFRIIGYNYPNPNFEEDMRDALSYFNPASLELLDGNLKDEISRAIRNFDFQTNKEHEMVTSEIVRSIKENQTEKIQELVIEAGRIRRFLG
jgi:phosphoenolpyruvate carboxylase